MRDCLPCGTSYTRFCFTGIVDFCVSVVLTIAIIKNHATTTLVVFAVSVLSFIIDFIALVTVISLLSRMGILRHFPVSKADVH